MNGKETIMITNQKMIREQARLMIGRPVCVLLKNGSFYVGYITDIEKGELVLSAKKGQGRIRNSSSLRTKKARVSGFFPGFGSPIDNVGEFGPSNFSPFGDIGPVGRGPGGAGGAGGGGGGGFNLGGIGGMFSFIKKSWPTVQMGLGMVKTIMPLLGGLGGLGKG
jgi:hypothetical protein